MVDKALQRVTAHGDVFRVHLVPLYLLTLHRLEGACTYVEGHLLSFYPLGA